MSLSGEEKRIRDLFDEMRREDERAAPPFARGWSAARARIPVRRFYYRPLRLAAVTIVLLAVALVVFVMLRQGGDALQEIARPVEIPPARPADNPVPLPDRPPQLEAIPALGENRTKLARRSRRPDRHMHAAVSLSSWRSPTDSLLKSPSDEMLKSLPRIGDSVKEMKAMLGDRMN